MTNTISFDKETAKAFQREYKYALAAGDDQFTFQGHDVLVSYAKYLCEHLTNQGLLDNDLSSRSKT